MLNKKQIILLITLGTALLLVVPLLALCSQWQWAPTKEKHPFYLFSIYLITETGSLPYALLTCVVLATAPLFALKLSLQKSIVLITIMAASILTGQIVKSGLKNAFQESRPYIVWLQQENYISDQDFYQLSRQERSSFIKKQNFSTHNIPTWQQQHWSKETGYSFPSGHSMFVAQWLLIYLLLLWPHRQKACGYLPLIAITIWATSIEISRLILGMHWPSDILVSCLFASFIVYLTCLAWHQWVIKHNQCSAK